jgi:hypothetical protein
MEIAHQKELKSKFKLQIITIFALKKNYHEHKIFLKSSIQIAVTFTSWACAIESEEMAMQLLKN